MPLDPKSEAMMAKIGYTGGGLGKKKDGIRRAISVGFKNDLKGVGTGSKDFGFSWWDHAYNKASSSIQIAKDGEGEVSLTVKKVEKSKVELYGCFVKSGGEVNDEDYSQKISDADLFAACEGRTARKGAIVDQPGKLRRVAEASAKVAIAEVSEPATASKGAGGISIEDMFKAKKNAKGKASAVEVSEESALEEETVPEDPAVKKKEKRKAVSAAEPTEVEAVPEKKKNGKRKAEQVGEAEESAAEEEAASAKIMKRKRKAKEAETAEEEPAVEEEALPEKHKKRKKKKVGPGEEAEETEGAVSRKKSKGKNRTVIE
ncbi:G patch domain-containing protein 4 [Irineochytrium annulatum]|nr:G patch domain-containing protein 4 [Irineochytrium annulatum]